MEPLPGLTFLLKTSGFQQLSSVFGCVSIFTNVLGWPENEIRFNEICSAFSLPKFSFVKHFVHVAGSTESVSTYTIILSGHIDCPR